MSDNHDGYPELLDAQSATVIRRHHFLATCHDSDGFRPSRLYAAGRVVDGWASRSRYSICFPSSISISDFACSKLPACTVMEGCSQLPFQPSSVSQNLHSIRRNGATRSDTNGFAIGLLPI